MVCSMTGFGRADIEVDGRNIITEIKSVNHRYFDFSCRTSRGYSFLEDRLKKYINSKVSRGKIDMFVSLSEDENEEVDVILNKPLARGYIKALKQLSDEYGITDDISVSTVSKYTDIFKVRKSPEDEEKIFLQVKAAVDKALESFLGMRNTEGCKLRNDILSRADTILTYVEKVEQRSPVTVKEYEERLKAKIIETLGDRTVDESRILTEVAIFSDRVAVAEETVRLRSHIGQMKEFFKSDAPIGRKLDFIVQEMNREANTIGSKVMDSELAHTVVDIKSEIEKIREQVQNIE